MFKNSYRRGRQARNLTTNVPKILDLKSSSEQIFSENWLWVPQKSVLRSTNLAAASVSVISPGRSRGPIISLDTEGAFIPRNFCFNRVLDWKHFCFLWLLKSQKLFPFCFFAILDVTEQSCILNVVFMFRKRFHFYVYTVRLRLLR